MNYHEKNRKTLLTTIQQLPAYEPGEALWQAVECQLEIDGKETALREALSELPSYTPPGQVWDSIREAMNTKPLKGRIFSLPRVAAAIALLILAGSAWLFTNRNTAKIEIVFSEVTEEENRSEIEDWDADEADFEAVLTLFQEHSEVESTAEIKDLESELEELDLAKEAVKEAIETFGSDTDLILQLSEIERQRSEVIKRMASYI